jgi:hypothetical protein
MGLNVGDFLAAAVSPEEIDTFKILGYEPHARQKIFHEYSRGGIDRILFGGAASGGKLIPIRENIPTPDGWVPMKDIHVGDKIFGSDGLSHTVTFESEVQNEPGYEFTFDDGSTATSHDGHLWLTYDNKELAALTRLDPEWRARRRARRKNNGPSGRKSKKFSESLSKRNAEREYQYKDAPTGTVRTTAEIVETLKTAGGRTNHAIPVSAPIVLPEKNLPIDPYVLGVWLGDGSKRGPVVTSMDDFIIDQIEAAGYRFTSMQSRIGNRASNYYFGDGLVGQLRSIGVLNNKHIPEEYLWSSIDQRLALVQGLMDTDGNILSGGTAEFVNTNEQIVCGLAQILRSLGHKVNVREGTARFEGRDYGPTWRIKFRPQLTIFRLPRKVERLQIDKIDRRNRFRYIVSAVRTESEDMKCIEVDSPDHLYLCTENFIPTHNTAAMIQDAIWFAVNYPKIRIGMHRKSYPELDESFIRELANWNYARKLDAKWNKTAKSLTLPNGSGIFFKFAETVADAAKILGGEYNIWYFDEASQTDPRVIQRLEERLRSRTPIIPVFGSRAGTNPGGIGAKYYKDNYIKSTDYGRNIHEVLVGEGDYEVIHKYAFVWSRIDDNPYVDAGYKATLMAIPDPARRAAMLNGDWDVSEGQMFQQWSRFRHVIPKEDTFTPPVEWQRYAGIDYGTADDWATIWVALDKDGRMWAYREYCLSGIYAQQQAQMIVEAERFAKEDSVVHVGDPSMWGHVGTPLSVADIYGQEGVGMIKANNERVIGWALCHQRLNDGPICDYHRYKKQIGEWHEDKCPMLHVFEASCPKFIETIPTLPRDENKFEDAKTRNVEDHMPDAWRYVNMYAGNFARPVLDDDYTPPTAQQMLERQLARPAPDYSQPMRMGMNSEDFLFPADLNNPSSRGGW